MAFRGTIAECLAKQPMMASTLTKPMRRKLEQLHRCGIVLVLATC
jgi:hypothetical protein